MSIKEYKDWKELPSNLKTKTRLKSLNLSPSGKPVARMNFKGHMFDLFDENEAKQIKYKTLEVDSLNFSSLNQEELNDYAIVCLTTTGTRRSDEIIQFTMLDIDGSFIFNKKFKPITDIHPLAYQAHKIASYELNDEPDWEDCWFELSKILEGKTLIMADYMFYMRMLKQTCKMHKCLLDFKLNILDLKSNTIKVEGFEQDFDSKNSIQSSNPVQDTITILNKLNPKAKLFYSKAIALSYFKKMCEMRTAIGENGYVKGLEWLQKNFKSSNFDDYDLRICNLIAKSLEPIVTQ